MQGLSSWCRTAVTHCRHRYNDRPVDMHLDIAVSFSGKTQVKVIETRARACPAGSYSLSS